MVDGSVSGRRKILKKCGATVAAFSAVANRGSTNVHAEKGFKDDIQRARQLRTKVAHSNLNSGSRDKNPNGVFVKHLDNQGIHTRTNTQVSSFALGSGSASSQKLEPNDSNELYSTVNIVAYHSHCNPDPWKLYVEYFWEWTVDSGHGEGGKDMFSFAWPSEAAEIVNGTWSSSANCEMYDRANDLNGISFKYDDSRLGKEDYNVGYDHGFGGVDCAPKADLSSGDTWAGRWDHTYQDSDICGFSVDLSGGISVSFCDGSKHDNGGFAQTDYAYAEHNYNNC